MDKFTLFKKSISAKYLVYPKIQIKYSLVAAMTNFLSIGSLLAIQYFFLSVNEDLGTTLVDLQSTKISLIKIGLFILAFSCLFSFLLFILITHRFLGPTISIKRALNNYLVEKKYKKINIRRTDEVQDLVEGINDFLQKFGES